MLQKALEAPVIVPLKLVDDVITYLSIKLIYLNILCLEEISSDLAERKTNTYKFIKYSIFIDLRGGGCCIIMNMYYVIYKEYICLAGRKLENLK